MFLEEITAAVETVKSLAARFDEADAAAVEDRRLARAAIAAANASAIERESRLAQLAVANAHLAALVTGIAASPDAIPDPDAAK